MCEDAAVSSISDRMACEYFLVTFGSFWLKLGVSDNCGIDNNRDI